LQKCTKTTVLHPKHAYSIDSNYSVVLAGLTKGEKIVASDPFPQTIKKFEVHNAIRLSCNEEMVPQMPLPSEKLIRII
jgi:hypothetical protein